VEEKDVVFLGLAHFPVPTPPPIESKEGDDDYPSLLSAFSIVVSQKRKRET
jgi:hypothetical protein